MRYGGHGLTPVSYVPLAKGLSLEMRPPKHAGGSPISLWLKTVVDLLFPLIHNQFG